MVSEKGGDFTATYVISDIHGQYDMFMELIDKIHLKETDTLYVLGDILDRGAHPVKILMKLMEMSNAICILGNHEIMALKCLEFLMKEITDMSIEELDEKMLDARICSDFSAEQNRDFQNSLGALLPGKLIAPIISLSGIDPRKKVHSITKEERKRLVTLLKHLPITVQGFRPISEAIVTSGGVNTREINPKTMQSKLVSGLYFAGEVIDVDAYTGGFNLQIAFSTAHTAALN